jgi:protein-S-isoprenylcysteine O-methyltransferase Ste14
MATDNTLVVTPARGDLRRAIIRRFAQLLVQQAVVVCVLLASAGTWRWPNAWAYLALIVVLLAANAAWVLPRNPEVVAARGRMPGGTRGFDKVILVFYTGFLIAELVVAGLDAIRFGWAPLSMAWPVIGAALIAVGMIPAAGAMGVNRNLEQTARIQTERGHGVATSGPYRYVRHPMYVGIILQCPGTALMLGSRWALAPAACAVVAIVVRTAFEDRMLRRDLPGYADYSRVTRYRLLPGVW